MKYQTIEIMNGLREYLVEAIKIGLPPESDREVYSTRFMGPEAGERAREYAKFKNDQTAG